MGIKKNTTVIAVILTLVMTFMEMTALPAVLFCNVKIKDINPIYITLMLHLEVYPFLQVLQFAAVWVVVSPDKYYLAMK